VEKDTQGEDSEGEQVQVEQPKKIKKNKAPVEEWAKTEPSKKKRGRKQRIPASIPEIKTPLLWESENSGDDFQTNLVQRKRDKKVLSGIQLSRVLRLDIPAADESDYD
jgi:hypothetical protein